ncbi:MAG: phosphate ABC transporter permease [Methylococcales bacterium]
MSEYGQNHEDSPLSALSSSLSARNRLRLFQDRLARYAMAVGGIGVIVAILLIFFYLVYEVIPLFQPPSVERLAVYSAPGQGESLLYSIDEQAEIGVRYTDSGEVFFFDTRNGRLIRRDSLGLANEVRITSLTQGDRQSGLVAFGLSDGRVKLMKHRFIVSYPNDVRKITAELDTLFEDQDLRIFEPGAPIQRLAVQSSEESTILVGWSQDHSISLIRLEREDSFLSGETALKRTTSQIKSLLESVGYLLLDKGQRVLYAADRQGILLRYTIGHDGGLEFDQQIYLVKPGELLTSLAFLSGDISLLAGSSSGFVTQWFIVRDQENRRELTRIREFRSQQSPITALVSEYSRKGFLAADASGKVGIYNTSAHRTLLIPQVSPIGLKTFSISPRADSFIAEDRSGKVYFLLIQNDHPEISWSSLWEKVWYENYSEPDYVWQSSAATNDFEPKFSLIPLAFGTLKAAFYAMLVAMPIAIFGAIYTAYFMAPGLRRAVKPSIEVMGALPTVILGFLAGLWLAPALETCLPGIFIAPVLFPLGVLVFAYCWQFVPAPVRVKVPDGWQPLLLLPLVAFSGWFSFALSNPIETLFFDGDIRAWLSNDLGIPFDQRNSIVVGVAMGIAVIPTIFSITEDAVFSVPKHLTVGSLALGATTWQTMTRVVILTASPGIFSALMIGLGRAVGETMIVLMATGNTPVMDFSIFQGMRTLAANIAVEMPESEVASTHYRVLFLAALVLFVVTFFFNTLAEIVRHRLRRRYSSL